MKYQKTDIVNPDETPVAEDGIPVDTGIERYSNARMDQILGQRFNLLDHGHVRVVDYMGSDESIVQAARTSYGRGTRKISDDRGLIRRLLRHRHTSVFEMAVLKLHIKAPIFVARQWLRHRTASVNEYSGRYSIMSREFFIPEASDICYQSRDNKQGRSTPLPIEQAAAIQKMLMDDAAKCYGDYETMLDMDMARELARMNLSVNNYTEFYWQINLHNLLHFLTLRIAPDAQKEIRVYAEVIASILEIWCPIAYEAWMDYRVHAKEFSRQQMDFIRNLVDMAMTLGVSIRRPDSISKTEWKEMLAALEIDEATITEPEATVK